jgi:3-hydroxyisobutyrate dehydrogenase-like beta-hydroxyacid dehydrogenase
MATICFLGTGLIGAGLAEAAARRGDTVRAWNRSPDKARALAVHGVSAFDGAVEAVEGADRVHLALSDDAAVDAVLETCGAGLAGRPVIDHSTTSPAGTAARAARLEAQGVELLHAPVFMSPKMCREAGGLMLAAGPRPLFDRLEPALRPMTGRLEHVGERRDLAAAYKLFGNTLILAIAGGLADVFTMAGGLEIAPADALSLFALFNPAGTVQFRGQAMARGDYRASFELAMARKDARLMLEAAGQAPLCVLPAIAARRDQLIARGHGHDDLGVLAVDAVPPAT